MTTQQDLEALCLVWQKRLRLCDWRIVVQFVEPRKLPKKYGDISYDRPTRTATIRILNPDAMQKRYGDAPVESTLVHELSHIPMPDITDENRDDIEEGIEFFTDALITAYEQKEPCKEAK